MDSPAVLQAQDLACQVTVSPSEGIAKVGSRAFRHAFAMVLPCSGGIVRIVLCGAQGREHRLGSSQSISLASAWECKTCTNVLVD